MHFCCLLLQCILKEGNETNKNNNTTSDIPNIKPRSNWESQKDHHTINTFIEAVVNDIEEILEQNHTLPRNNISKAEKTIINEFSKRDDLVFTKADKGGATVILHVENYIEKANKE